MDLEKAARQAKAKSLSVQSICSRYQVTGYDRTFVHHGCDCGGEQDSPKTQGRFQKRCHSEFFSVLTRWRTLDPHIKLMYYEKARQDKARYKEEIAFWADGVECSSPLTLPDERSSPASDDGPPPVATLDSIPTSVQIIQPPLPPMAQHFIPLSRERVWPVEQPDHRERAWPSYSPDWVGEVNTALDATNRPSAATKDELSSSTQWFQHQHQPQHPHNVLPTIDHAHYLNVLTNTPPPSLRHNRPDYSGHEHYHYRYPTTPWPVPAPHVVTPMASSPMTHRDVFQPPHLWHPYASPLHSWQQPVHRFDCTAPPALPLPVKQNHHGNIAGHLAAPPTPKTHSPYKLSEDPFRFVPDPLIQRDGTDCDDESILSTVNDSLFTE